MRRIGRRTVGVVMAVVLAIGAPAALAQSDEPAPVGEAASGRETPDVDTVRERALEAIDRRLEHIERLRTRVESNRFVARDHEAHLVNELRDSARGLADLSTEIEDATTIEELRALVPAIATDFRVYLVVTPKVVQVLGSDAGVAAGGKADEIAARIEDAIDRAAESGVDVSAARDHLDDLIEEAAAGLALADPVAESVLPLEPSDWPEPARAVLADGRADLLAARQWFRQARESAREAVEALRAAIGAGRGAAASA